MTIIQSSGESTIQAATRRNGRLFAAYIMVLIVTALIIAVFTWLTWDSGNDLQDAIRQEGNARISEASKGVAQLQQDNLRLSGDLETEKGKVASLQTEAAKQQERAAKAEKDLLELQERIKSRFLSAAQRTRLIALLSANPGRQIGVFVPIGDAEAFHYAQQLADAIRAAHWQVNGPVQAAYDVDPEGLLVTVRSVNEFTGVALFLANSIRDSDIPVGAAYNGEIPTGNIELRVGHKANPHPN